MKTKVLVLLISIIAITTLHAIELTFKELAQAVSKDLNASVYVDKDIENYKADINIADYQKRGEITSFFTTVLFDHNMYLKYNSKLKYYTVAQRTSERKVLPAQPILSPFDQLNYYTYRIKNITNKDVVKVLSIFDIKYVYLSQSDVIAYSCKKELHSQIDKLLRASDNKTKQVSIKISIFNVNKNKLKDIGTMINKFGIKYSANLTRAILSGSTNVSQGAVGFEVDAYMTFLKSRGITTIEQSPTILLTNGIKAQVNAVSNVRYVTGTASLNNNNNNSITQNYEYRDVGLKISLLPKIKNNWVFLDMDFTSEEFISFTADNPIVGKISYKNSFKIQKGKPLLLTGINKSIIKKKKSGIPLLKDLPYIGKLFGSDSTSRENQNINILIEVL